MSFKYIVPFPLLSSDVRFMDVINFYKPFRDLISYIYLDLPSLSIDYYYQGRFLNDYFNFIEQGTKYFKILLIVNPALKCNSIFSIKKFFSDSLNPILLRYKISAVFSYNLELLSLVKKTFPFVSLFYRYTSIIPWTRYAFWKRYVGIDNLIMPGDAFKDRELNCSLFNFSFVPNEYCYCRCPNSSFRVNGFVNSLGFCKSCLRGKPCIDSLLKPSIFRGCNDDIQLYLSGFHQNFFWIKGLCCLYFLGYERNFMQYINCMAE